MSYFLFIKPSAKKELLELPDEILKRIDTAIEKLHQQPRPHGIVKLEGQNLYRIRIGDYRIIYIIEDKHKMVEIIKIGHRKDVYK